MDGRPDISSPKGMKNLGMQRISLCLGYWPHRPSFPSTTLAFYQDLLGFVIKQTSLQSLHFWIPLMNTDSQRYYRAETKVDIFTWTEGYSSCFLKMLTVRSAEGLQEAVPPPPTSAVLYVSAHYIGKGIVTFFSLSEYLEKPNGQ